MKRGICSSADVLKALDEAIHDGVDILSVSIGSGIPLFSEVDNVMGLLPVPYMLWPRASPLFVELEILDLRLSLFTTQLHGS